MFKFKKNICGIIVLIAGLLVIGGSCKHHRDSGLTTPESTTSNTAPIETVTERSSHIPPQRCVGAIGSQCANVSSTGRGRVAVGSILHDNCCIFNYPNGYMCNNGGKDNVCGDEWWKAVGNVANGRIWRAAFTRDADNLTPVSARTSDIDTEYETAATARLKAPNGTALDVTDKAFCKAKRFRQSDAQAKKDGFGICGGCGLRGKWTVTLSGQSCRKGRCVSVSRSNAYTFNESVADAGVYISNFIGKVKTKGKFSIYKGWGYTAKRPRRGTWSIPTFMGAGCGYKFAGYATGTFKGNQTGCSMTINLTGEWGWYNTKTCQSLGKGSFSGKASVKNGTKSASLSENNIDFDSNSDIAPAILLN